jgi:O-antigen/teichoic acid export membrane protein
MKRGGVGTDAAWSLAYLVATRLGTFAISVVVARWFGAAGAGAFGLALQVSTFGAVLAGMNLAAAVAKDVAASPEIDAKRAILETSLRWVLGGGLVVALVIVAFAGPLARDAYRDPSIVGVLTASGPLALATALFVWGECALQGLRWFRRQALWGSILAVVDLAVGVVAALGGIVTLLIARSIVRFAAVMALAIRFGADEGGGRLLDPRARVFAAPGAGSVAPGITRRLFAYAIPSLLASTAVFATLTVLRVLLVHHGGLGEAGYYQAADSLGQGLVLVPFAAASAFMPAIARDHAAREGDLGASLGRALRRVAGFNLPLCLLAIAWATPAIRLIYGADFSRAREVLVLLALGAALSGLAAVLGAVLLGRGEVTTSFGLNLAWGVVAVLLFRFVWLGHGAVGVAGALAAAHVLLLAALIATACGPWGVSFRGWWTPVAASVGTALAVGVWTLRAPPSDLLPALAGTVLAVVVFVRWGVPELRGGSLDPSKWRLR